MPGSAFGRKFLEQLIKQSAIQDVADLLNSAQLYRVHDNHSNAIDTRKYLEAHVYISEKAEYGFGDKGHGITVRTAQFFYLVEAKKYS